MALRLAYQRKTYSPQAPRSILFPIMHQQWLDLSFIHWPYKPEVVQQVLPAPLEVETHDGWAWVGLVPFVIANLRPFSHKFPRVLPSFPETNLRTYVRGPDGDTGVWFFSLEAKSLTAVAGARFFYRLPYMWARMSVVKGLPHSVWYKSLRHWPGKSTSEMVVRVGAPIPSAALTELDYFLTARFSLYTCLHGRWARAWIEHPAWPLRYAKVELIRQDLTTAAGLPMPTGYPIVHYCDSLDVKISWPQFMN